MDIIDSNSRKASAGSVPRQEFVAQDRNSRLFDTRCGVRVFHPLLNATCVAVHAIVQVYLSYVLNIRSISTDCFTPLEAGKHSQKDSVGISPTESRWTLRRSVKDVAMPTNWAPARIISTFIGKPRVFYPNSLRLIKVPRPTSRFRTGPGRSMEAAAGLQHPS